MVDFAPSTAQTPPLLPPSILPASMAVTFDSRKKAQQEWWECEPRQPPRVNSNYKRESGELNWNDEGTFRGFADVEKREEVDLGDEFEASVLYCVLSIMRKDFGLRECVVKETQ